MADANDKGLTVHASNGAVDVHASTDAINALGVAIGNFLHSAEEWSEHNPYLFVAVLLLVEWAMFLRHRSRVETSGMRIEYEERRNSVRLTIKEPELRLENHEKPP